MLNRRLTSNLSGGRSFPFSLSLHLFREFILPLCCALLAFSLLFLLNDVFDDAADFAGKGVPAKVVFLYFLCKLPINLVHVIPVSVLLATSFMTIILGKNNELYAMRSAGLSLAVCAVPVWLSAFFACAAVWGISEKVAPLCQQAVSTIQQNWLEKRSKSQATTILFNYPAEFRRWFFNDFREDGKSLGVVVRQLNSTGATEWVISSQEVEFRQGKWIFKDGEIYSFALDKAQKPQRGAAERFDSLEQVFTEYPHQIAEQSKPLENLSIRDIYAILHSGLITSVRTANQLRSMFWHRLTFPLSSLVGAMFAFALSLSTGRSGHIKGFATAAGILVLFFVLGQLFLVLGKNGWVPPFIAGAFFPLVFFAVGIILVRQRQ